MTITLPLKPEEEARLLALAKAKGRSTDQSRLEMLANLRAPVSDR